MPKLELIDSGNRLTGVPTVKAVPKSGGSPLSKIGSAFEAVERIGRAAEKEANAEAEKLAERKAKIEQQTALSETRSIFTQRFNDLQDEVDEAGTDFRETILTEFDEAARERLRQADPRIKDSLEAHFIDFRGQLETKAGVFEAARRAATNVRKVNNAIDLEANVLLDAPEGFDDAIRQNTEIIDGMELAADKRKALVDDMRTKFAVSAVSGLILDDPRSALASLQRGDFDAFVPPAAKLTLLARAKAASTQVDAEFAENVRDHLTSVTATGEGLPGVEERVEQVLDAPKLKLFKQDLVLARQTFQVTQQLQHAPASEMVAVLDALKPKAGEGNFVDKARAHAAAVNAAVKILKVREDDPRASVATIPSVQAIDAVLAEAPEGERPSVLAFQESVATGLAAQESVGIPKTRRRALTRAHAQAITADLNGSPPALRAEQMKNLEAQYGKHFPAVLKDLVDKKFSGGGIDPRLELFASALGPVDHPLSAVMTEVMQIGRTELKKGLAPADVEAAFRKVDDALEPYRAAIEAGDPSGGRVVQVNGHIDAVKDLALFYMRQGQSSGDAAEKASNQAINDRFEFEDTYYFPTHDVTTGEPLTAGAISRFLDRRRTENEITLFRPLATNGAANPDDVAKTIAGAANSGIWVTNEDATGVFLIIPLRGGGAAPLIDADGARYEFLFIDAAGPDPFGGDIELPAGP